MKKLKIHTDNSIVEMEVSYCTDKPIATGTTENASAILTRLIQDTGRFCLHYASDLFFLWSTAVAFLGQLIVWDRVLTEFGFIFGIREDGVDSAHAVADNLARGLHYYYRAIYCMEAARKNDGIHLSLYKVDRLNNPGN